MGEEMLRGTSPSSGKLRYKELFPGLSPGFSFFQKI